MQRQHVGWVGLAAATAVLAGCDARPPRGAWVPDDVALQAGLGTLGEAGYARLCSALEGYVRDTYRDSHLVQAVCLAHGVQTADTAVACGEAVQACTTSMPPAAEATLQAVLAQASCQALDMEPRGCAATVAQVKACADALEGRLDALKFGLACSAAGERVDPDWWRIRLPAACEELRTLCPRG
jgi:uncharacterized protein with beta-barrel porin domain